MVPGEHGERGDLEGLGRHLVDEAGRAPLQHRLSGLGRHVAAREAGAACGRGTEVRI